MNITRLKRRYLILPYQLPFYTPGFKGYYREGDTIQSPSDMSMEEWETSSFERLLSAMGKDYLPICRLSDGEFKFLLGDKRPSYRSSLILHIKYWIKLLIQRLTFNSKFEAKTLPNVSSGSYNMEIVRKYRSEIYPQKLKRLSKDGVLALHLSYSSKPFQEHFFPDFGKFLAKNDIYLNNQNYIPFYFVYGWLRGDRRKKLLENKRVLLVHSAEGEKKEKIENYLLLREKVQSVGWLSISSNQSLFSEFDLSSIENNTYDIAFLGAGVGKMNLFDKLSQLSIPIIDIGFVFEVWYNEDNRLLRTGMISDSDRELGV